MGKPIRLKPNEAKRLLKQTTGGPSNEGMVHQAGESPAHPSIKETRQQKRGSLAGCKHGGRTVCIRNNYVLTLDEKRESFQSLTYHPKQS